MDILKKHNVILQGIKQENSMTFSQTDAGNHNQVMSPTTQVRFPMEDISPKL